MPPPMSMSTDLLNEVFRFKHKAPSERQDAAVCQQLVTHFCAFVQSIQTIDVAQFAFSTTDPLVHDRAVPLHAFATQELTVLQRACARLARKSTAATARSREDIWIERWLPQYGCALQLERTSVASVALKLVFLDAWSHVVHFPPTGDCVHSAVPKQFRVLHCGAVAPRSVDKLMTSLTTEIEKAKTRTGTNRSAGFNEIGHQKTPQFIAMLLRRVLAATTGASSTSAANDALGTRGGTTDVGLHTGGGSRDTCWPLVQGVLQQNLPGSGALWDKAMLLFQFSLLSGRLNDAGALVAALRDGDSDAQQLQSLYDAVDDTFAILQRIVLQTVELVQRGYSAETLEKKCTIVQRHLVTYLQRTHAQTAKAFALPTGEALQAVGTSMKYRLVAPFAPLDVFTQPAAADFDPEANARTQLEFYLFVDVKTCSAATLLKFIRSADSNATRKSIHLVALRLIERFLFRHAMRLNAQEWEDESEQESDNDSDSDYKKENDDANKCTPEQLQDLLVQYERHLACWKQAPLASALLDVEQHSLVLLIKWIAFCLAHRTTAAKHIGLHDFGIALQWQHLEVVVLRTRESIDALLEVAKYIRAWNSVEQRDPLFDLNQQEPTARFARAFAAHSKVYVQRYDDEVQRIANRVATNWNTIVSNKAYATSLRTQIASVEEQIADWSDRLQGFLDELALENQHLPWNRQPRGNHHTRTCRDKLKALKLQLHWNTQALMKTLVAPQWIASPLPKDRASALETLFFIDMPADIALLFALCLSAQRALAPRPLTVADAQLLEPKNVAGTSLRSFFRTNGGHATTTTAPMAIEAYQDGMDVPGSYGPTSIELINSHDECSTKCVWYPNENATVVLWTDPSSKKPTNPYAISLELMRRSFTLVLPRAFQSLQWAIEHPGGGDAKRGNKVYAKLSEPLPDPFEHQSFVQFGSLRAFPHLQIRKICSALKDNSLPWSHPCVIAVVRQAMYQVGELSDVNEPELVWKNDVQYGTSGLRVFIATIEQAASRLKLTPRDFEHVPLLGELAGFLSQYSWEAQETVTKFAAMCRRWADDIRKQWQNDHALTSSELTDLRAKECLLYGYALQCWSLVQIDDCDDSQLRKVGELLVLFCNAMLFANGSTLLPAIQRLEVVIDEMMARCIHKINEVCSYNLTALLRLVNARAPAALTWQYYTYKTDGYYESYWTAKDKASGTHYAINLFTGAILTDGSAPGGLPRSIRDTARFHSLFGATQDFEVTFARGVYRTTHAVNGCYYEFILVAKELHVREVYCDARGRTVKTLELCSIAQVSMLAVSLPARITELHALWLWSEHDVVFARPHLVADKATEFVLDMVTTSSSGNWRLLKAYEVPVSDKALPHSELLTKRTVYDFIVMIDAALLKILHKFELDKYIHTLRTPSGDLKICFPRFRLSFLLRVNRTVSSNALESQEYEGYVLDTQQQFEDAFPTFAQYLVLRLDGSKRTDLAQPLVRIIVPVGQVVEAPTGVVSIQVSSLASARIDVAVFDVHRRLQTLSTELITSRLLLSALLASTGRNTPSTFFHMTGAEAALAVLKGCYSSHVFSQRDKQLLHNLCLFAHREPALKILASCILQKSVRCSFLTSDENDDNDDTATASERAIDCSNELDEYCAMGVESPERNRLRTCLDATEERLVLGYVLERESSAKQLREPLVELDSAPVSATFVHDIEETLARFLAGGGKRTTAKAKKKPIPTLPLTLVDSDAMSKAMNAELQDSWRAYHHHPDQALAQPLEALATTCELLLTNVHEKRAEMEVYLRDAVTASRNDSTSRLLALINYLATPTVADLIRSSFDANVLLQLVPRLSLRARSVFQAATLQFMELCVLEDKLERLVGAAQQQHPRLPTSYFVDELNSVRRWESSTYPYWLAFEVEGRLQIRHEQFVVAHHLIRNAGAVCQMNMGRGKTRVILPMLFLYFSHRHRGDRVVRAHFLTPLLSETRQFMHQFLSASSILNLNFIEQPFHRNIELSADRLQLLCEDLAEAQACGKFLLLAPEHRMSLELKRHDVQAHALAQTSDNDKDDADERAHMVEALDELLDDTQFIDVLDESDAILHHKYHLIYAVGVPQKLASGESRWLAAQALLSVLTSGRGTGGGERVQKILQQSHVCFHSPEYATRVGSFTGLRLNASVANKDVVRTALREAIVLDLIDDPPFALKWLQACAAHHSDDARNELVQALTNPSVSLDAMIGDRDPVLLQYRDQVLALRGLLAFGILEHCLEKRHRVEYGLPELKTRPKRMAIPFRAADIPSERSEFSHPEVGIVSTVLAYYHTGLRTHEMKEALTQLLQLGVAEQAQFYTKWLDCVRPSLRATDLNELPLEANQLCPHDARQFVLVHRTFQYAIATINFFLNTCVFPNDTTQFPNRLARSAWHLASGSRTIGFSGTNDNHRLLPTSMRQHEPNAPTLLGTNGKMIDRILKVAEGYEIIHASNRHATAAAIPWQVLLQSAMTKRVHALIDTGALLAGVLNNDAALYLLELESFIGFAGVTYYDTRKAFDCWVVLDASSRVVTPLKKATILEKDTFVIFDDARSRGSDMKLKSTAIAMLTLGPKITKDKLMQGAGRMRQLGCDQKIWLASLSEVAQSILQVCEKASVEHIEVVDILDWVMHSTKSEAVHGLLEWASSGLHFGKTQVDAAAELVNEDWSLDALYSRGTHRELICDIVYAKVRALFGDTADDVALVDTICARTMAFGLDEEVLVSATQSEECERELHNEHNEEREGEVERLRFSAVDHVEWDVALTLRVTTAQQLAPVIEIVALGDFVRAHVAPRALAQIDWSSAQIFGTRNFFATVALPPGANANAFARHIDALLVFDDGSKLLVSDAEADRILALLWHLKTTTRTTEQPRFSLVHLPFVVDAVERLGTTARLGVTSLAVLSQAQQRQETVTVRAIDVASSFSLAVTHLATLCQLYNGETMFTKAQQPRVRNALRVILQPMSQRETSLQTFAAERRSLAKWRYSLLHDLCHEMDLEAIAASAPRRQQPKPKQKQKQNVRVPTRNATTAQTAMSMRQQMSRMSISGSGVRASERGSNVVGVVPAG